MAENAIDWRARALAHASSLRIMLCIRDGEREPGSQLSIWYEEAKETERLAIEERRSHGEDPGVIFPQIHSMPPTPRAEVEA